ncbi:MAG TPA: hypothetical protein VNI02_08410 [Blastocatellia bacterium]|jgi:hypothetical protein|nr:hypothetical protein [Blastocatellia bacterium]
MKRLQSVLSRYRSDSLVLGPTPEFNLEELKSELKTVITKDKRSVLVRLITVVAVIAGMAWAIWHWHDNPQTISLVLAGSGVTLSWLVNEVLSLWGERAASQVVLVLVVELGEANTKSVVTVLSKNIRG